jgi:predicted ATPase
LGGGFRAAADLFEEALPWLPGDGPRMFGQHVGVGAYVHLATALWILGESRPARVALAQAVGRAEALEGPTASFTRAHVHCYAASLCHIAGFASGLAWHADRTVAVSAEHGFASFLGAGMVLQAMARALTGDAAEHIPAIVQGLEAWRGAGAETYRAQFLLGLAEAHLRTGTAGAAIEAVDEALEGIAVTGERILESPLHRLRGELLYRVAPDDPSRAAAALNTAVDVARRQEAGAFEQAALERLRWLEDVTASTRLPASAGGRLP